MTRRKKLAKEAAPPVIRAGKGAVFGRELPDHPRFHGMGGTGLQIGVQILAARLQRAAVDAGLGAAFGQPASAKSPAESLSRST